MTPCEKLAAAADAVKRMRTARSFNREIPDDDYAEVFRYIDHLEHAAPKDSGWRDVKTDPPPEKGRFIASDGYKVGECFLDKEGGYKDFKAPYYTWGHFDYDWNCIPCIETGGEITKWREFPPAPEGDGDATE